MSGQLAHDVFEHDITPGLGREILVVFALHANGDGTQARPKRLTVARLVGCSERTVDRHVRRWIDQRVMRPLERPRRREGRGRLPTVYRIDLSPIPLKPSTNATAMDVAQNEVDQRDSIGDALVDVQRDKSDDQRDTAVPGNDRERPLERPKKLQASSTKKSDEPQTPWRSWSPTEDWPPRNLRHLRRHLEALDEGDLFRLAPRISAECRRLLLDGKPPTRAVVEIAVGDVLEAEGREHAMAYEREKAERRAQVEAFGDALEDVVGVWGEP